MSEDQRRTPSHPRSHAAAAAATAGALLATVSRELTFPRLCLTLFGTSLPLGVAVLLWDRPTGSAPASVTCLHVAPIALAQVVVSWRLRNAPWYRDLLSTGVVALLGLTVMSAGLFAGAFLAMALPLPIAHPELVPALGLYGAAACWAARRGLDAWRAAAPRAGTAGCLPTAVPVGPHGYGPSSRRRL